MSSNKPPEPGIFPNVPFEEYLEWDCVSASRLKLAGRSMAHYQVGSNGEPTPSMNLRSLCHAGVLEPLAIAKRYCFMPDYSKHEGNVTAKGERSYSVSTKFVLEMQEQFKKLHFDKEIITEESYNKMIGIAGVLGSCPVMRALTSEGQPEVSIVWDDPGSRLRCRSRCDWLRVEQGRAVLLDLKTTADASEFERAIVRYGYHRQMAFYRRAVEVATGVTPEVRIVAIETAAPYGHKIAPMDPDALDLGALEVDRLLAQVALCNATNEWPSYDHPDAWKLPEWYTKRTAEPLELVLEDGETILV